MNQLNNQIHSYLTPPFQTKNPAKKYSPTHQPPPNQQNHPNKSTTHPKYQYNMNKSLQKNNAQSPSSPSPPKYHPYTIPPSVQLCNQHRICSQFGKIPDEQNTQTCPCCNSPPRQPLKIGCTIEEIYQVTEPAGYYFTYIKLVIVTLVIVMLITGVYTLIQIFNQCHEQQSQKQTLCLYIYGIPMPKIRVFLKIPLIILNSIVILVLYIFSAYLFFRHSYLHQKNINSNEKPSDFSVMLSGFDHRVIKIQHLREILFQYHVQDIIYTHKIKKYLKRLSEKSVLDAQLQIYRNYNNPKSQKIYQKIQKLDNLMLHTKNKLTLGQDTQLRTDKVIITFKQAQQKKNFEQLYKLTLIKTIYHTFCGGSPLVINGCPVYIEPLGEPNEIIWQNLEVTAKDRYIRVFISNTVTILLLCGSFVMVAYLTKSQEDRSAIGDALMSIVFAVLIEVVNEVLTFLIEFFTGWQGRYTLTGEISMKLYKNCAAFFLNTTLLPFFLFVMDWLNPEQDDIIRNILSLFFISNLISPYIGLLLQPQYILKQYYRRKIQNQNRHCIMTQIKANKKFEKIDFKLDERYALLSQLIMNCMFYAAIFPIGILITIIGMVITYWSSKWWILNYCSLTKFSYRLGKNINIISCIFPTIYAFGYAANIYMVKKQAEFDRTYSIYIAAATIPITILFILFGESISRRWIIRHRQSVTQENLNKKKILLSYKRLNPTSFIHDNLAVEVEEKTGRDMWTKLVSYVAAKESGILDNQFQEIDSESQSQSSRSRSRSNRSLN